MFNSNSSSTLGFINLENKKDQLLPILKHYEFFSVVRAIFAINSWRNNRGSQESCLALNFAITSIDCWGEKEISTYSDFYAFFDEIYPILKTSNYDDPVLCDFGEIKLDYENRYYSVITGTGHTACVFAALQYLEPISNYCSMNQITENLLQYSNTMINHLLPSNAQITDGFSNAPKFECPSKNYYLSVIDFFVSETWNSLSKVLFFKEITPESFEEKIVLGCFPLLPMAAYALLHISEIVGQNERTLFTYLSQKDELALGSFLDQERDTVGFVTVDLIYNYFEDLFKKEIFNSRIYSVWAKTNSALRLISNESQKKIIKTIAVIKALLTITLMMNSMKKYFFKS